MSEAFRTIPKVDSVLNHGALQGLPYGAGLLKRAVQEALDEIRSAIAAGEIEQSPGAAEVAGGVARKISDIMDTGLRPVINAAGVIVYTNLGRAPLSREAIDAVVSVAQGYSDLEYDLKEGKRGSRQAHIRPVTRSCFGVEDALVVNNNAAAVMLVLLSLAKGKEVIVSRGELVEIGGSFRMPDVMALSGAVLREVGATNKTRLSDYRNAISDNTALIMKVHRSNFSIVGFTEEVEIRELASLAREIGIPLFVDMGSGVPFDLSPYGIAEEWTIDGCLEQGADVLCFSADKVLGGPQAGIILSSTDLVEKMARHPLHRAVRVDKMVIASLAATLSLLARGQHNRIPVLAMITEGADAVKKRAGRLKRRIGRAVAAKGTTMGDSVGAKAGATVEDNMGPVGAEAQRGKMGATVAAKVGSVEKAAVKATVIPTRAIIGGGSAPTKSFPSYGVQITSPRAVELHARLRTGTPAVVCRIEDDRLVFDLKAVPEGKIDELAARIIEVLGHAG